MYVWDVRSQKARASFFDEGCINGSAIAVSPDGRLLACGSETGIVNQYYTKDIISGVVRPSKVFSQLVTRISSLQFNQTSEALVFSSDLVQGAVRIVSIGVFILCYGCIAIIFKLHLRIVLA